MLFFKYTFCQIPSKPLEHNFTIENNNMIVLINAFSLIKKIQYSGINFTKSDILKY
jgi:hypothetical protein